MHIKVGRIAIAVIAAEILGVLSLVILVVLFGPSDRTATQAYAERLGFWVGPISGFVFCLLGAFWVARRVIDSHITNGLALGIAAAALDIGILIAIGTPFKPIFALSNVGRVFAGIIGGWLAGRPQRKAT
jgi:hypothetical protein